MPDATPPRPLTAEDVEQRLLADVAEARAQLAEVTADRDHLAAKLAETLAANQRWAETLGDVQQRHAEVKRERDEARAELADAVAQLGRMRHESWAKVVAERDEARSAFAKLAAHFTQGAQSGWTARISGTVLRRLCAAAGCEPPSGTGLEALAEANALVAERDVLAAALRRIALGAGIASQAHASVIADQALTAAKGTAEGGVMDTAP